MIRNFDGDTERFLSALEISQQRSSRALNELSSGYRVTTAADAPGLVIDIIRLNANVSRAEQVGSNLALARNEADIVDTTLQTAIDLFESALHVGVQATDVAQTAATRAGLAMQVKELHQQLFSFTRLNVQGRYVFSGDSDQQVQYTLDPADIATGVTRNFAATSTRLVTDLMGGTFNASLTAEQIFDHRNADDSIADDNAFAALMALHQALINDDSPGITAAVGRIKLSLDHLNEALSFYGGIQNRIANSAALVERYQLNWKQSLGEKRDADPIRATTELQATRTQQDASLAARARFAGKSLFDYLS